VNSMNFPAISDMDVGPILATLFLMLTTIIIVWIATNHRRRMAEIEARTKTGELSSTTEIRELKQAVGELQEQLHAQVIAVDNLVATQTKLLETQNREDIQSRLGGESISNN
jgi:DNA-binding protein H-NS